MDKLDLNEKTKLRPRVVSFMIDEELIVMKSAITSKQSWKTDKPPLLINSEQKS